MPAGEYPKRVNSVGFANVGATGSHLVGTVPNGVFFASIATKLGTAEEEAFQVSSRTHKQNMIQKQIILPKRSSKTSSDLLFLLPAA